MKIKSLILASCLSISVNSVSASTKSGTSDSKSGSSVVKWGIIVGAGTVVAAVSSYFVYQYLTAPAYLKFVEDTTLNLTINNQKMKENFPKGTRFYPAYIQENGELSGLILESQSSMGFHLDKSYFDEAEYNKFESTLDTAEFNKGGKAMLIELQKKIGYQAP